MMAKNGLILLTPTTVDKTGTGSTATINANGSVTFGSCTALSLNGVFSSTYDNYRVVMRATTSGASIDANMRIRLRLSGTDSTDTTLYNDQYLDANSTTISAARNTTLGYWTAGFMESSSPLGSGLVIDFYGPNLVQPTAFRAVTSSDRTNAYFYDSAGTHEGSTSYDGLTFTAGSGSLGGLVCVYGLRN
jgi:hypothetical protein